MPYPRACDVCDVPKRSCFPENEPCGPARRKIKKYKQAWARKLKGEIHKYFVIQCGFDSEESKGPAKEIVGIVVKFMEG